MPKLPLLSGIKRMIYMRTWCLFPYTYLTDNYRKYQDHPIYNYQSGSNYNQADNAAGCSTAGIPFLQMNSTAISAQRIKKEKKCTTLIYFSKAECQYHHHCRIYNVDKQAFYRILVKVSVIFLHNLLQNQLICKFSGYFLHCTALTATCLLPPLWKCHSSCVRLFCMPVADTE